MKKAIFILVITTLYSNSAVCSSYRKAEEQYWIRPLKASPASRSHLEKMVRRAEKQESEKIKHDQKAKEYGLKAAGAGTGVVGSALGALFCPFPIKIIGYGGLLPTSWMLFDSITKRKEHLEQSKKIEKNFFYQNRNSYRKRLKKTQ